MLHIDLITVLPDLVLSPLKHSILKRAQDSNLIKIKVHDLKDYGIGKHRQVDDYSFGGAAGMVMQIEPIYNMITHLKKERTYNDIIYMSPDGKMFDQSMANTMSLSENLIFLCGHYKGIDHRIREHIITKEISIGPYVLTGGELPALVCIDAICRLVPGAMSDGESALTDSFQDGYIAPPVYSRPQNFNGWEVPEVLTSGNFKAIENWKMEQIKIRTEQFNANNKWNLNSTDL